MSLTKEHIDSLVAAFCNLPQSPKIYISEYEDLTNKLYTFQRLEEKLKDRLGLENVYPNSETTIKTVITYWFDKIKGLSSCHSKQKTSDVLQKKSIDIHLANI